MSDLFNVAALFVLLRESLEAALIVGVLINYIKKTHGHDQETASKLKKAVWWGAGVGLVLSVIIGAIFTVIFYVLKNDLFRNAADLFEGIMKTVAVVFLTWMAFGMLKAENWYEYWEKKLNAKIKETGAKEAAKIASEQEITEKAPVVTTSDEVEAKEAAVEQVADEVKTAANSETDSSSQETALQEPVFATKEHPAADHADYDGAFSARPRALFGLAFSIVAREGLESVVFITGIGQGNPIGLIAPGIVGLIVGILIGLIIYFGTSRFRLDIFLKISAAMLWVISAGLAAGAAHEFAEDYYKRRPELGQKETPVIWDICGCCSQKNNAFFAILYALMGWRCEVTVAILVTYVLYWVFVIAGILGFLYWKKKKLQRGDVEALGAKPHDGVEAMAVTKVVDAKAAEAAVEAVPNN